MKHELPTLIPERISTYDVFSTKDKSGISGTFIGKNTPISIINNMDLESSVILSPETMNKLRREIQKPSIDNDVPTQKISLKSSVDIDPLMKIRKKHGLENLEVLEEFKDIYASDLTLKKSGGDLVRDHAKNRNKAISEHVNKEETTKIFKNTHIEKEKSMISHAINMVKSGKFFF